MKHKRSFNLVFFRKQGLRQVGTNCTEQKDICTNIGFQEYEDICRGQEFLDTSNWISVQFWTLRRLWASKLPLIFNIGLGQK